MKKLLSLVFALVGIPFAAFAQENIQAAEPTQPERLTYQATVGEDQKKIVIERNTNLILAKNERFDSQGVAVQGCGFARIVNIETGEDRYVDIAAFLVNNPNVEVKKKAPTASQPEPTETQQSAS